MKDVETLDTTIDEWRAELQKFNPGDVPGWTLQELCKELKVRRTTMQNRLQDLIDYGRCTWFEGTRTDKKGRSYTVTVYQLIREKEKK